MANEKPCDFCKGRAYTKKPVTIITAYGKRFVMIIEYCPNCGRKLRTEDAVEVVRCEKCLFRSQYPDENGRYKCGGLLTEDEELLLMVKPDFFCAYGERRGKDAAD